MSLEAMKKNQGHFKNLHILGILKNSLDFTIVIYTYFGLLGFFDHPLGYLNSKCTMLILLQKLYHVFVQFWLKSSEE